jgi:GGDEF domain-containing protein
VGNVTDFLGHIGGDDFVLITTPNRAEPIAAALIRNFDAESRAFYTAEDLQRGNLAATDRQGHPRTYPLVSLSIGIVSNHYRPIASVEEVSRVAAEVKHKAKAMPGSTYWSDRRTADDYAHANGRAHPTATSTSRGGGLGTTR